MSDEIASKTFFRETPSSHDTWTIHPVGVGLISHNLKRTPREFFQGENPSISYTQKSCNKWWDYPINVFFGFCHIYRRAYQVIKLDLVQAFPKCDLVPVLRRASFFHSLVWWYIALNLKVFSFSFFLSFVFIGNMTWTCNLMVLTLRPFLLPSPPTTDCLPETSSSSPLSHCLIIFALCFTWKAPAAANYMSRVRLRISFNKIYFLVQDFEWGC